MQWHYVKDGQAAGPADELQMAELERQGILKPDSFVWTEGLPEWKALSACREQLPEPKAEAAVLPDVVAVPVLPPAEEAPLELLAPRPLSEAQPLFPDDALPTSAPLSDSKPKAAPDVERSSDEPGLASGLIAFVKKYLGGRAELLSKSLRKFQYGWAGPDPALSFLEPP